MQSDLSLIDEKLNAISARVDSSIGIMCEAVDCGRARRHPIRTPARDRTHRTRKWRETDRRNAEVKLDRETEKRAMHTDDDPGRWIMS